jgi:hypothetical protein
MAYVPALECRLYCVRCGGSPQKNSLVQIGERFFLKVECHGKFETREVSIGYKGDINFFAPRYRRKKSV